MKAKVGVSQINKDTPAWATKMTAIIAALALVAPDLIASLPGTVSPITREWLEWILKALAAISALIAVFVGKSEVTGYKRLGQ